MVPRKRFIRTLDKMPDFMPGAPVAAKLDVLYASIEHQRHVLWKKSPPNDFDVWFAPDGTPYSALNLPRIVRPKEAGSPQTINFFAEDIPDDEMKVLPEQARESRLFPESILSLPPPDIYGKRYALDSESSKPGGSSDVLLP